MFFKTIAKFNYQSLNRLEISSQKILANLSYLRTQGEGEIVPVLKANAYGHGLKEISIILNKDKQVKTIAIDSWPEYLLAHKYFKGKILILSEMPLPNYLYLNWQRTEVCIYNQETLEYLAKYKKGAKIHLFINTGMNREGIDDIQKFYFKNRKLLASLKIQGLASHLAKAHDMDSDLSQGQVNKYFQALDFLKEQGIEPKYKHLLNSAGFLSFQDPRLNLARIGLALYGYNPLPSSSKHFTKGEALEPALSLLTKVIKTRKIKAGESVSYNDSFIAKQDMYLLSIPFGYSEGLPRALSNQASFTDLKQGLDLKLVGDVSMNLSCLSSPEPLELGREVLIISRNKGDKNSLENLTKIEKTIIYEFLVRLKANLRRKVI